MKTHTHEGVLTSTGALRSHPINRKHSKTKVQVQHNSSLSHSGDIRTFWQGSKKPTLAKKIISKLKKKEERVSTREGIVCQLDKDEYINIDLRKADVKGIRVVFQRTEGRTKRRVGLQIDK